MLNVTLEQAATGSLESHDVRNEVPRRAAAWVWRASGLPHSPRICTSWPLGQCPLLGCGLNRSTQHRRSL